MDEKPPEQSPPSPTAEPAAEATAAGEEATPTLFPLATGPSSTLASTSVPQWLSNSSFTADISLINDAVASQLRDETALSPPQDHDEEEDEKRAQDKPLHSSYEILESSESEGREREKKKKKKKKKRKGDRSRERGGLDGYGSRKSRVRAWADSESSTAKDYYFDSHGDRDNLAFGCIYRYFFFF